MTPSLPRELLIHIFEQLPPSRAFGDNRSVNTLISCSLLSTHFHRAATVPSIWEQHYRIRYTHSDPDLESQRAARCEGNWFLMYTERRRLDSFAKTTLAVIVHNRIDRYRHAYLLSQMGFDVWDYLDLAARQPIPQVFRNGTTTADPAALAPSQYGITEAMWARLLLQNICRTSAIRLWARLANPEQGAVPFVEGYLALSCFLGESPYQMASTVDALTERCRAYMSDKKLTPGPHDPATAAALICDFMKHDGFSACSGGDFGDLYTHLPHKYLTTHKRTLPISLVHVFATIARSLGLEASPVGFPGRVLAYIRTANDTDDIYVDVFAFKILSISNDLPAMWAATGGSADQFALAISPCGAAEMLLRCARNVMAYLSGPLADYSLNVTQETTLMSLLLGTLLQDIHLAVPHHYLFSYLDPLDCMTYIPHILVPAIADYQRTSTLATAADSVVAEEVHAARRVRLRSAQEGSVQHFVGMIFEHAKHQYVGSIIGWDGVCEASEEWTTQMNVSQLPRGRNQPFYSVFAVDGSRRYVAEDNIRCINGVQGTTIQTFFKNVPTLPTWFSDTAQIHLDGEILHGRFLLSPDLERAYPEDNHIGEAWVSSRRQ